MLKPTTIASNLKFRGRVIDVSTERLKYANGREYDIDFVRHPGAAAVVAVDARDRLCVVRQYRHGSRISSGRSRPASSTAARRPRPARCASSPRRPASRR